MKNEQNVLKKRDYENPLCEIFILAIVAGQRMILYDDLGLRPGKMIRLEMHITRRMPKSIRITKRPMALSR